MSETLTYGIRRAMIEWYSGSGSGEGKSLWLNVHIDGISDLFIAVYDAATKHQPTGSQVGHGPEGLYFGEIGEHRLYDISKTVSQEKSPKPTMFTEEKLHKYFEHLRAYMVSNSRCHAERSRSIGYTAQDMLASIKPEIEASLSG
ncbi:hypothetical protein SERLADRAFT_467561 [Serpula lacrymans var. lacrymans S7.9]|uniref:Uncharacterized protein n=1 Tax=Serpula lacrymans var. lacrymans (strain S7.9) TaxID=578457 RepID=F8NWH5_SERL9|nr:uncharacterized protein SERLADRAFT_467561 [Serpula lacrymans var. lacrymans S7.9]EGO24379.1 hypothetical protein SERLADRAFT_467561 [Serpula lacrymans var. lacrymans S7.9]